MTNDAPLPSNTKTLPAERRPSKGERDDLIRLVKQRVRLAKAAAAQRAAAMLAEFERQISAIYSFDDNETWAAANAAVERARQQANERIAAEAGRLGIPKEFQPRITSFWMDRGQNAVKARRDELRKLAVAEVAAAEKSARVQIETASLEAQTAILATGLTSDAALALLERMPSVDALIPQLDVLALQARLSFRGGA